MTHTIFGHSLLYTAKTFSSSIHFTLLHSLHANTHGRPCFVQVYFRLSQLSFRQHLTTTNTFSGADMKSVVRTSRWSSTLRYLPVSGFSWSSFPTHCCTWRKRIWFLHLSPLSRKNACIVVHLSLYCWKISFEKTEFFLRLRVSWKWVWSTMVEMVCSSPVRFKPGSH